MLFGAIAICLFAGLLGLALAPFHLTLTWRKHWHSPLAWAGSIRWCFGGLSWSNRSVGLAFGGWVWRSRIRFPYLKRVVRSRWRYWLPLGWAIARVLRLEAWQGQIEVGLSEPDWTGMLLGWVATLPPAWAQRVRVTFERSGGRGRGRATWRGRSISVIWCWVRYDLSWRVGRS